MTPDLADRLASLGVSRETFPRLGRYVDTLAQWNARINLVGRATEAEIWTRHVLDSVQLLPLIPQGARLAIDLGSGAGLPGLILAIVAPHLTMHLVDSDQRKCVFLREAARLTETNVSVHATRIEALPPFAVDLVTARALAPLHHLLGHAAPFLGDTGAALFLKGRHVDQELTDAEASWSMRIERRPSLTESEAAVLRISRIERLPPAPAPRRPDHRDRQPEGRGGQDHDRHQSRDGARGRR